VQASGADPRVAKVHYLGHGRVEVVGPDGRQLAYVVADDAVRWVFVDGHVYEVTLEDAARPARRPRATGHDHLAAPMPASVVKVLVAVGQRVERGTTLVVLEAMKMELPLKAPHDAVVAAVRCAEGELVQPGVTLVDLDVVPLPEGS
jgi:3-methylcrotonyl-CoA carboxylase alpha subunit